MNHSNFRISLDIHEMSAQVALYVKKGDTARKILATLTENGKPYRISANCNAVFTAKKPDGNILYNACTIDGNDIEYPFSAQTTNVAGELACELRLYGPKLELITSPRFCIVVDDTVYSDGDVIDSTSEGSALSQLLTDVTELKEELETARDNGEFDGEDGATFLPAVSAEGVLSWSNDKHLPNPQPFSLAAVNGRPVIVRGEQSGTATYEANVTLPTISTGSGGKRQGKGLQILFIPDFRNPAAPTLRLNGGEAIEIRRRAEKNKTQDDDQPDATQPLPEGCLMRGVPYMLTFCGMYWLLDSYVSFTDEQDVTALYTKYKESSGHDALQFLLSEKINTPGSYVLYDTGYTWRLHYTSVTGSDGDAEWRWIERYTDDGFYAASLYCGGFVLIDFDPDSGSYKVYDNALALQSYVDDRTEKDVSEECTRWKRETGKDDWAFLKTLPAGMYRMTNGYTLYRLRCIEIGPSVFRWIESWTDDGFFYITLTCNDKEIFYFSTEETMIQINRETFATRSYVETEVQKRMAQTLSLLPIQFLRLEETSWEQIRAVSEAGFASAVWPVGAEKTITVDGETLTLVITGFAHDDLADGSGKAGITFGLKELMANQRKMNESMTNVGGFCGSEMYDWLQNTLYPALPEDLRAVIRSVRKRTSEGNGSATIVTENMPVFLFSEAEIFGKNTLSYAGEGSQYAYFRTEENRIKRLEDGAGEASYYFERSPTKSAGGFCLVSPSGTATSIYASAQYGVCFGFCV